MNRHHCNNTNHNEWAHCAVCGGRIHEEGCTAKKRPGKDCPGQQYHSPLEMELAGYGKATAKQWLEFQATVETLS